MKKLIDVHTHLETLNDIVLLRTRLQHHLYKLKDHIRPNRKTILSVAMYVQFYQEFSDLISLIKKSSDEFSAIDGVKIIYNQEDLESSYKIGIIFHIESGRTFTNCKSQLEQVYKLGVRGIIPMHFHNNKIGQSCDAIKRRLLFDRTDNGLSSFGEDFVSKCNELGTWLDLTHCTDKTANDILNIADTVMVSHVGLRDLVYWNRNFPIKFLQKIAEKSGIIGIIPWMHLIGNHHDSYEKTISFAIEHGLEKSICIGSDFGSPIGTHPKYSSLFDLEFAVESFPKKIAEDIKWNNAYRFYEKILSK